MDENTNKEKNKISNPLTMIGVFAGLSETAGVVVLPLIAEANQKYFMWYVMGFPVLLVCLFYYVLIRHPVNLYAPSDFRDEKIYERLRQRQIKATAALTAAAINKSSDRDSFAINSNEIADIVIKAASDHKIKTPYTKNIILWVDDNPDNNFLERSAFENVGLNVLTALSTDEALNIIKKSKFSAIISDMGRAEGPREGYELLDIIRKRGLTTPFFIYSGSNDPEHKLEAFQKGAQGSTCYPHELFSMVMNEVNMS